MQRIATWVLVATVAVVPFMICLLWLRFGTFAGLGAVVVGGGICFLLIRILRKSTAWGATETSATTPDRHQIAYAKLRQRLERLAATHGLYRAVIAWSDTDRVPYVRHARGLGTEPPLLCYKQGELKLVFGQIRGEAPGRWRVYCDIMQRSLRPEEKRNVPEEHNPVVLWKPGAYVQIGGIVCADFGPHELGQPLEELCNILETSARRAAHNFRYPSWAA